MRVKSIEVHGLFGVFDHEIPLVSTDHVSIIFGPNGFGKTVMLKMIAGVLTGDRTIFEHTPFREFSVRLDDGTQALVRRGVPRRGEGRRAKAKLEFLVRGRTGKALKVPPAQFPAEIPGPILDEVDRRVPGLYRRAGGGWADDEGKYYSLSEIVSLFPEAAAALPPGYRPPIFEILSEPKVFFIQADRLGGQRTREVLERELRSARSYRVAMEEAPSPVLPRVEQYSRDLVERIQAVLAEYAKHSQERDRTFPERLVRFAREGQRALSEQDILDKMAELENKRRRLITLGLLDREKGLADLTQDDVRGAPEGLSIYVDDVTRKLEVFDDIARRIGSLVDIVNGRFRYKRLSIDRERGFRVESDLHQPIALEDLSSGEQHELVLLYEILFHLPRNGLVLIDEPEISLHVAWQSRFLADLIDILKLADAYAIVATHSPVIIGSRTDLMVELKGPSNSSERPAGSQD